MDKVMEMYERRSKIKQDLYDLNRDLRNVEQGIKTEIIKMDHLELLKVDWSILLRIARQNHRH